MFLVATALFLGFDKVPEWATVVEQKMYPDPIVVSKKTPYQNLTLTHNVQNDDTRLYINGSTQFSSIDEVRYHEALVHIPAGTLSEAPKRALVLGGGDGMAVRELKKYDGIQVDLIELDRDMFKWSKTQPELTLLNKSAFEDFKEIDINNYAAVRSELRNFSSDGEHRVFYTDANNFINAYVQNQVPPRYDIIVIDLPDPYNLAINKMYTLQFYKRLNALLNEDGVIVSQSTSPFHAPKVFATIGKTMRAAGYYATPYRQNIPSFGEWGWWLASKSPKQFEGLNVDTEYFTNELAKASFIFGKNELLNDETLEVNSLMRPVLVRLYSKESWKVE
jgi:spermidine synthase